MIISMYSQGILCFEGYMMHVVGNCVVACMFVHIVLTDNSKLYLDSKLMITYVLHSLCY